LRVVSVPESFVEPTGVEFRPGGKSRTGDDETQKVAFLDDNQVIQFMEAAQGNAKTKVMQAPRITLFDSQASTLEVGETRSFVTGVDVRWKGRDMMVIPHLETIQLGLQVNLKPDVSADHRFIRLKLKAKQISLDALEIPLSPVTCMLTPIFEDGTEDRPVPFTQFIEQPKVTTIAVDKTLCLPDGRTALIFAGKRVSEYPNQGGPSILSKVPYLNGLFKDPKNKRETECVLFMVTPRIVSEEAAETRGVVEPPVRR